ncbi:MAG: rRNA maturation RNase YbeY [Patescibacteria group bacterium]|nr:rRNA maturation RNase YbeY [Patescibacteria group bacterium]MCL5432175.1 rRNA maturation RNase YbeY [Patescibacteria group bacterium]
MAHVLISADSKFPVNKAKIKAAVEATLRERRVTSEVEVSVLICGRRKSQALAKKYLRDNTPHNVLSFPQEGFPVLGDIAVCYPLAQREANDDNVLVDTKIGELVSHGVLHLLGIHHE